MNYLYFYLKNPNQEMQSIESEIQVRADNGYLDFFNTKNKMKDAMDHIAKIGVKNISKVSFDNHRYRPKFRDEKWNPYSEQKLKTMSKSYANSNNNSLFWIDQQVMTPMPDLWDFRRLSSRKKEDEDYENQYYASLIVDIKTDEEFKQTYLY